MIVNETITIAEGTSVNIRGATPEATADGSHATQLFHIDGALSSLHLTDMILTNGFAKSGGAVQATDHASVSLGGNTTFRDNIATCDGGAVTVTSSSKIVWDGKTIFKNNTSVHRYGGGLYVPKLSNVSWTGNTIFLGNFAKDGAGLFIHNALAGTWSGTTTFEDNAVNSTGGGFTIHTNSKASWTGETTFARNIGYRAGALFVWSSDVFWTGNTTFADNIADTDGGAVYATVGSSIGWQGTTVFRNNTATTGNGGALGVYGYLSDEGAYVNVSGCTTFINNSAFASGGAIFSSANSEGHYFEEVVFQSNSASVGGAVATFGTGNGDELQAASTTFLRCQFLDNTAEETGGAVASLFGQEHIISSEFSSNFAGEIQSLGLDAFVVCDKLAQTEHPGYFTGTRLSLLPREVPQYCTSKSTGI